MGIINEQVFGGAIAYYYLIAQEKRTKNRLLSLYREKEEQQRVKYKKLERQNNHLNKYEGMFRRDLTLFYSCYRFISDMSGLLPFLTQNRNKY
jgi:hypothetical protein